MRSKNIVADAQALAEALRQAAEHAKTIQGSTQSSTGITIQVNKGNMSQLADDLKSDNSTTQAIAVRIANLQAKYPNRAF